MKNRTTIILKIRVVAINQNLDEFGIEYICIEFGCKPLKIPVMIPPDIPKEMENIAKMAVRMMPPPQTGTRRTHSGRMFLRLTVNEWEDLEQRYTVGDEFTITVLPNGELVMKRGGSETDVY